MQVQILNGIYADVSGDIRISYPINLVPTTKPNDISTGYLKPVEGIIKLGDGPGLDRGGINWNGLCYRVMGTKLILINADFSISILGDVGGYGQVTFNYSFDRLSVSSSGLLFYWDGTNLTEVTDVNLGIVIDHVWVDGYFMTTDGEYLVVTELNDPTQVSQLKYGSSEANPDPVKALVKIRNEVYVPNRYTTELFDNVGGSNFPFNRIEGAQIQKGAIGTHAACAFMDRLAFVGSGENEAIGVYVASNGGSEKVSSSEIDKILSGYTEDELEAIVLESKTDENYKHLMLHLPDQTLVFDGLGSQLTKVPVWFILRSAVNGLGVYRSRNFVRCYNKWITGDPNSTAFGYLTDTVSTQYGDTIGWEFATGFMYSEGKGAIINELELVSLMKIPVDPSITESTIFTSYSNDGMTWSLERLKRISVFNRPLKWLKQGYFRNWRILKFRGTSELSMNFIRLEVRVEPTNG